MTKEEKIILARFLDLAEDQLRDGYKQSREAPVFVDDAPRVVEDLAASPGEDSLESVAAEILCCTRCPLHSGRTRAVPGEGAGHPLVLVIGEGPGAHEDASGRPFVGNAGQLLDKMLASIGLSRERNCFIANMVKCRPPNNRDPLPEETGSCASFLARQIALLNPRVILCVGRVAAQAVLKTNAPIGSLRGRVMEYPGGGNRIIPLLPTYHPSALLRDDSLKRPAWEDLKLLRKMLMELDDNYARDPGEGGA